MQTLEVIVVKENTTRLVIVLIVSAVLMVFHINFLSDKHIEINIVNDKPAAQTIEQPKVEQPKIDQPKVEQPKVEQPKPTTIVQPAADDVKILVQSNQKAEEAKRLLSRNKSEDAIKLCNESLELNPNTPVAYMMRGYGYQQLGDLKRAIVEYNRAIELDPNYALAYFNRGVAFEHLYNREQAVIDLSRAIELEPLGEFAYFNRGVAYSHMNKNREAIADFTTAINIQPNYAAAYQNRAICYNLLGDTKRAQEDFDKAKELGYKSQ